MITPIRTLFYTSLLVTSALCAQAESGFVSLFDGKTLNGWDYDPQFWRVEDGVIVGETTTTKPAKTNTFLTWAGGEPADFELKVEFKIRNHNSGIQYRSFPLEGTKWALGGYQADFSADHKWTGVAYGEKYKGLIAKRGEKAVVGASNKDVNVLGHIGDPAEILSHVNIDGWNEYHIIASGNHCIQLINGIVSAEFSENDPQRKKQGLIGLQLHRGPPMEVRFRNIRLREMKPDTKKQILFLAGKRSHGYNAHEHKAGCLLLARCLNESGLDVIAQVVTEGAWPEPWQGYDKPDAVVMYCDGFKMHLAKDHQDKIQELVDQGVGVACLHFGVEVEPKVLGKQFLDWIGGYFESGWSVNPHWDAEFTELPEHPITNGVKPFKVHDEWYYHMRFRPDLENVTPILSSLPPVETLTKRAENKSRGSNPAVMAEVSAGKKQVVAWAYDRPNGGRGFGFTGGHFHRNWKQDDFRKIVLNALVWIAKGNVPADGVPSRTPSVIDMGLNQDYPERAPKNNVK